MRRVVRGFQNRLPRQRPAPLTVGRLDKIPVRAAPTFVRIRASSGDFGADVRAPLFGPLPGDPRATSGGRPKQLTPKSFPSAPRAGCIALTWQHRNADTRRFKDIQLCRRWVAGHDATSQCADMMTMMMMMTGRSGASGRSSRTSFGCGRRCACMWKPPLRWQTRQTRRVSHGWRHNRTNWARANE